MPEIVGMAEAKRTTGTRASAITARSGATAGRSVEEFRRPAGRRNLEPAAASASVPAAGRPPEPKAPGTCYIWCFTRSASSARLASLKRSRVPTR